MFHFTLVRQILSAAPACELVLLMRGLAVWTDDHAMLLHERGAIYSSLYLGPRIEVVVGTRFAGLRLADKRCRR